MWPSAEPHAKERPADCGLRVVILAPAAADLFERLGAAACVVGVTNGVDNFPAAAKVGTHLNPGIEKTASLRPGLIVAASRLNPELAGRMGAELFVYEPQSLEEIISLVRLLSGKIGRPEQGNALAGELRAVLDGLTPPARRPTVLYETRSAPLSLAGADSVIRDLLERAGFRYAHPGNSGLTSVEYLLHNQPDFYLYQEGPMNRNPLPPKDRPGWGNFRACAWKVDEFAFARPNTGLFETALRLNEALNSADPCARGDEVFR